MAERRMFAKAVINSARFLRMPPTSRLLYYDLGMAADDDGIVEAFTVMRTTGATEDDLRVLAAKGFITVLNDDLVSFINDWKRNNLIKKDRYHESIYAHLLVQVQDGTQVEPEWNPDGTQAEPEVRLGKVRLGKARGDKGEWNPDETQAEPPSHEDVRRFMNEYASGIGANIDTARSSDRFWNHQQAKGWNVQDWHPLARNWIEEDVQRQRTAVQNNPALAYDQRSDTDYSGRIIDLSEYADDEQQG